MIITSEVKPSPYLAPYIRSYNYREFDTEGQDVTKPKHAVHEIAMHFFFEGLPVKLTDPATGHILKTGKRSGVSGMYSKLVGTMTFNGCYSFFEIAFMPHGFESLFGIPAGEILDKIVWSEEIFDHSIDELHEQLFDCGTVEEMCRITDSFLLCRLHRQKHIHNKNRINHVMHSIIRQKGSIHIDALASEVNMSVRNFERLFLQHLSIPAKLFCCITRFNHALDLKLRNDHLTWTQVAHHTGYFDHMHLIKDFRKFSGEAPSVLLKETPLLIESYIS